jgi:regulatory protein
MKITAISSQLKDRDRVNVLVDGKYRFSLDICQVIDLGVKVGREYSESELAILEKEGQFGKIYARALEYCLMRPHSSREMYNYLYRKTRPTRCRTGEVRLGVAPELTSRVFNRLIERGYINDQKFADYWVENRLTNGGISRRKLIAELRSKGVDNNIIEQSLNDTERNDSEELQKIINKKRTHYPDDQKFMMYLARLGFNYDDIKRVLNEG